MEDEFIKLRKEKKEDSNNYFKSKRDLALERFKDKSEDYFSKERREERKEKYKKFGESNPLKNVKGDTGTLKKAFGV